MIEQSTRLGEDGTDYLADELLHTTLRTALSSPIIFCTRRGTSTPTFLTDKDRKDTGACMTRAKGPNLWNANGRF